MIRQMVREQTNIIQHKNKVAKNKINSVHRKRMEVGNQDSMLITS